MSLSLVFNPISGTFDYIDSGNAVWGSPVATLSDLQAITTDPPWTVRVVESVDSGYVWNGSSWIFLNLVKSAAVGSSPNADGYTIDAANTLTLQPANTSFPGALTAADWNTFNNKVSSVGLADTSTTPIYTVSGSPVTSAGTIDLTLRTQTANTIFSGPSTGSAAQPTFRSLVINDIPNLASIYVTQSEVGVANGVASLDSSGKIPASELPSTVFQYLGSWNPSTNSPALADGTGVNGDVYRVSTAYSGTVSGLNDPSMTNFQVGNLIIYNGSAWQQSSAADGVVSVNGAQGIVTVNAINQLTGDVTAGPASQSQSVAATISANAVTNAKLAQMAANTVKANITGSTANASDVALGTVTETASSVLTLSGWTDATIGSPTITVKQASGSQSGYLSSTDWTTFNNKQSTLTIGNLTDSTSGADGITVTGGTGAVIGSGTSIAQAKASGSQNGYLASTDWTTFNNKAASNTGDIAPTSFSMANSQSSPANVTGLAFNSATVHGAQVLYSIVINSGSSVYESGMLLLCNINGSWQMVQQTVGNSTGIVLSVTNAGQVQYTSPTYGGLTSAIIYFRAQAT